MKVGIFTGTFDPVHEGHISFISEAIASCGLDTVLIFPEHSPRGKREVTPHAHRVAMLEIATKNLPTEVKVSTTKNISMQDIYDTTSSSSNLYLLLGTDVALTLKTWPELPQIIDRMKFIVGVRSASDEKRVGTLMSHLGIDSGDYSCITTHNSLVSSTEIRTSRVHKNPEVMRYIQTHGLYKV